MLLPLSVLHRQQLPLLHSEHHMFLTVGSLLKQQWDSMYHKQRQLAVRGKIPIRARHIILKAQWGNNSSLLPSEGQQQPPLEFQQDLQELLQFPRALAQEEEEEEEHHHRVESRGRTTVSQQLGIQRTGRSIRSARRGLHETLGVAAPGA